jgi:hypothetical protein
LDRRVSRVRVAASSSHKRPAAVRRYGSPSLSDAEYIDGDERGVEQSSVLFAGEASYAENTGDVHGQGSGQRPSSICTFRSNESFLY